ncbi:hypothetical protein RRG08_063601 [Elysia crispata]|uniref:Uncharacterized protein n=1 Tax=Elysia crispata TaxID=231223 RepID=A0AAE0YTA3_9GAST|nr:hypothetical protein RRG08_063601 [Elysia crispata]
MVVTSIYTDVTDVFMDVTNVSTDVTHVFMDVISVYADVTDVFMDMPSVYIGVTDVFMDVTSVYTGVFLPNDKTVIAVFLVLNIIGLTCSILQVPLTRDICTARE